MLCLKSAVLAKADLIAYSSVMFEKIKKHLSNYITKWGKDAFKKHQVDEFHDYLSSPWRIMWANFLAGTMRGLGFLLGAALVIALMGFILKEVLSNIPMVGDFFKALNEWIEHTLQT